MYIEYIQPSTLVYDRGRFSGSLIKHEHCGPSIVQRTSHMSSLFYCLPLAAAKICIFIAENVNITHDFIPVGGVGKGTVGQSEVTATETGMPRNGDTRYSIIRLLTILLSIL